jgi:uncharacterized protein (TIGR03066 family)
VKALRIVTLGALILVIVGCGSSKPQDLIIGKWEGTEKMGDKDVNVTVEFVKDGTMNMTMVVAGVNVSMPAKYKFTDDKTFEVEMTPPGATKSEKEANKIESIDREKLVFVDSKGKKVEFKKKT